MIMHILPEYMDNEPPEIKDFHARSVRNKFLLDCDYTQMVDVPMSEEDRALWGAYRQQLRDLPDHPDWPNVDLPDKPYPDTPTPQFPPSIDESI